MERKRIYVCCGSGIATSTVISKKVKEAVEANKIPYTLEQCTVQQISSKVATLKPDLIVSSAQIPTDVNFETIIYPKRREKDECYF